eukprot:413464-Pelagomonas_calceolata.AAC.1
MPACDNCYRTYHWGCLIDVKAFSQNDRELFYHSEHWDCPACTSLSDSHKAERINFSEDCEMIYVEWHPEWEAEEQLRIHPDLDAHIQAFDPEEHPELIEDPLTIDTDLENFVNQGFEGNPQSLADSSWISTTGCMIRKNVTFDF